MATFDGTTGADNFTGGNGPDVFNLFQGGSDKAKGADGDDEFYLGAALNGGDRLKGGAGFDDLYLAGNYSGLVLQSATLNDIERINLTAGFDYNITLHGDTASGTTGFYFYVEGESLGVGDQMVIDGSAETTRGFYFVGGAANDVLIGGGGADGFRLTSGGDDTVSGGLGQDSFDFANGALTAADRVDGGGDYDSLHIPDGIGAGVVFDAQTMISVEYFQLGAGFDYSITLHDNTIANGSELNINGGFLGSNDRMIIDGSSEHRGSVRITGGAAADKLTGGGGADQLFGGAGPDALKGGKGYDYIVGQLGRDVLTGGRGADGFEFATLADSKVTRPDLITDLNNVDTIFLNQIDANGVEGDGDQAFTLVLAFTGAGAEVQLHYVAGSNTTFLEMDVDGDSVADSTVALKGDHTDFTNFLL